MAAQVTRPSVRSLPTECGSVAINKKVALSKRPCQSVTQFQMSSGVLKGPRRNNKLCPIRNAKQQQYKTLLQPIADKTRQLLKRPQERMQNRNEP